MDKLPSHPKLLDAPKTAPASIKFQVKSVVGHSKPVTVTVIDTSGDEVTKTSASDSGSGEISDKSKGEISLPAADTFIRFVAKDAKDESVSLSNVSVAEWLRYDNGTLVVPLATAKESAKDEKAGKREGPSYYTSFRDCKTDSSANKGGYVVIRFQFGKAKEGKSPKAPEEKPAAAEEKPPKEEKEKAAAKDKDNESVASSPAKADEGQRSGRVSVVPAAGGSPMGGPDTVIVRLRMAAASGLVGADGLAKDAYLEVYGPRPEAGKRKSTAPRIVGGLDEKESHSALRAKGLLATRTAAATIGKNSKGEPKYSWPASDARTIAIVCIDPAADSGSAVRVEAYERGGAFLGEASISVPDLLASAAKGGNMKMKLEARKDEADARILAADGKLGQLLVDVSQTRASREASAYTPPDGQFTHLRLQVTRCEGLRAAGADTSNPVATVRAGRKEVFSAPQIDSTLYPMWGGEASCLVPLRAAAKGVEVEVRDKGEKGAFLGRSAVAPTGPAGCVLLPLCDENGALPGSDAPLGTVTVAWLYESLEDATAGSRPDSPSTAAVAAAESQKRERTPSARRSPTPAKAPTSPVVERAPSVPAPVAAPTAVPAAVVPVPSIAAAPVQRTPSSSQAQPVPVAIRPVPSAAGSAEQNPVGLVADFLRDARPVQQDQYALSPAAAYGITPRADASGASPFASPPKKVPITVPALLKLRGVDMEALEAVPRPSQIRFLQSVLRDVADHLLLDPVQLSIVNVGAAHGMLIDFKFQLTEDQARRNIMDAFVQKTLAGMLTMRYANAAYVEQLGGRPSADPLRAPNIVAETAATFGEFRATADAAPRLELNAPMEASPNRSVGSPLATRGTPRMAPPPSVNYGANHQSYGAAASPHGYSSPAQQRAPAFAQPHGHGHHQQHPQQGSPMYAPTEGFRKPYVDQMVMSPNHRVVQTPPQQPYSQFGHQQEQQPQYQQQQQQHPQHFAVGTPRQFGASSSPAGRAPSPHQQASVRGPSQEQQYYPQHSGAYPQQHMRPPSPTAHGHYQPYQQQRAPSQGPYVPQQRQPAGGLYQGFAGQQQGMPSSNFR